MNIYLTPTSFSYFSQLIFAFALLGYLLYARKNFPGNSQEEKRHIGLAVVLLFWITIYLLLCFFESSLLPSQTFLLNQIRRIPPAIELLILLLFAYHYPTTIKTHRWEKPITYAAAGIYVFYEFWQTAQNIQMSPATPTQAFTTTAWLIPPIALLLYLWSQIVLIRQTILRARRLKIRTLNGRQGWRAAWRQTILYFREISSTSIFWITLLSFFLDFFYLLYLTGIPNGLLKFTAVSFDLDNHFAIFTLAVIYINSLRNANLSVKLNLVVLLTITGILGMTGWFLETLRQGASNSLPAHEYLASREVMHQYIFLYGSILLGSVLAIFATYTSLARALLIKPLDSLLNGIQKVKDGDLTSRIAATARQDEIGRLVAFFNQMTASLNDLFNSLDKRVLERTNELTLLNEELKAEISQRSLVEASLRNANQKLSALYRISEAASNLSNLRDFLNAVLEEALLPGYQDDCFITTLTPTSSPFEKSSWQLAACRGINIETARAMSAQITQPPILKSIYARKQPFFASRANTPRIHKKIAQAGYNFLIALPIQAEGQIMGFLSLVRKAEHEFSPEDTSTLKSIADQIGVAIHVSRQQEQTRLAKIMEDRQILAENLHDAVTQSVYSINMLSEAGKIQIESGDTSGSKAAFQQIGEAARQALTELRLFIHQLRPSILPDQGLIAALHSRLAAVEGRSGAQSHLVADEKIRFSSEIENELYLFTLEALNNILRHARASVITVSIQTGNQILLKIEDNGRGFSPDQEKTNPSGMGLANMSHRIEKLGGVIDILSAPGAGAIIQARIPYETSHSHSDR